MSAAIRCQIRASCLGSSSKPLSALSDLVGKRVKYLGETARYSVGAIAINALQSIKAATRKYSGRGSARVVQGG